MKVMLVDDRPLVRNGIASLLRAHSHEVVAEANDGLEALALVGRASPDLNPHGYPNAGHGWP